MSLTYIHEFTCATDRPAQELSARIAEAEVTAGYYGSKPRLFVRFVASRDMTTELYRYLDDFGPIASRVWVRKED